MTSIERPLSLVVYVCTFNKCTKKSCSYHQSVVYKRAGMQIVELKNLQKHRAMDEKSFYLIDDVFLATASQPAESFIEVGIEVSLSSLRHYCYLWGQGPASLCHVRSN